MIVRIDGVEHRIGHNCSIIEVELEDKDKQKISCMQDGDRSYFTCVNTEETRDKVADRLTEILLESSKISGSCNSCVVELMKKNTEDSTEEEVPNHTVTCEACGFTGTFPKVGIRTADRSVLCSNCNNKQRCENCGCWSENKFYCPSCFITGNKKPYVADKDV